MDNRMTIDIEQWFFLANIKVTIIINKQLIQAINTNKLQKIL